MGIVLMVFVVNVVPTILAPDSKADNVLTNYGDTIGAFLGAGAAILFALQQTRKVEKRKRAALATALKSEVISNLFHLETFFTTLEKRSTWAVSNLQRVFDHAEIFDATTLVCLSGYQSNFVLLDAILETRKQTLAEVDERRRQVSESYSTTALSKLVHRKNINALIEHEKSELRGSIKRVVAHITELLAALDKVGAEEGFQIKAPYAAELRTKTEIIAIGLSSPPKGSVFDGVNIPIYAPTPRVKLTAYNGDKLTFQNLRDVLLPDHLEFVRATAPSLENNGEIGGWDTQEGMMTVARPEWCQKWLYERFGVLYELDSEMRVLLLIDGE